MRWSQWGNNRYQHWIFFLFANWPPASWGTSRLPGLHKTNTPFDKDPFMSVQGPTGRLCSRMMSSYWGWPFGCKTNNLIQSDVQCDIVIISVWIVESWFVSSDVTVTFDHSNLISSSRSARGHGNRLRRRFPLQELRHPQEWDVVRTERMKHKKRKIKDGCAFSNLGTGFFCSQRKTSGLVFSPLTSQCKRRVVI